LPIGNERINAKKSRFFRAAIYKSSKPIFSALLYPRKDTYTLRPKMNTASNRRIALQLSAGSRRLFHTAICIPAEKPRLHTATHRVGSKQRLNTSLLTKRLNHAGLL
jgi:hypothetical protein